MILSYGVVRPTITKALKVNNPGIVIYEVIDIRRYPGGCKDPMTVKTDASIDFTKNTPTRRLTSKTWKGFIEENLECTPSVPGSYPRDWGGTADLIIFDSLASAINWKVHETDKCLEHAKEKAQKFLDDVELQGTKIKDQMKNIIEENPEYFLWKQNY